MRLFAATADGVWVLERDNRGWQVRHAQLQGRAFEAVAASPHQRGVIFAGADGHGLFRSVNGGGSWRPMSRGLESPYVHSIAFDATDPRVIFVSTLPAAIYRSGDGGETWEMLPWTTDAAVRPPQATAHPVRPGQVYVLDGSATLHRSGDGGRTWQAVRPGAGRLHALAALPTVLLLAADEGMARSTDDGAAWALAPATAAGWAISAGPAGACLGLQQPVSGGMALIASQDGGCTWVAAPGAARPALRRIILAATTIFGIEETGALLEAPWQAPAVSLEWSVVNDELPPVLAIERVSEGG